MGRKTKAKAAKKKNEKAKAAKAASGEFCVRGGTFCSGRPIAGKETWLGGPWHLWLWIQTDAAVVVGVLACPGVHCCPSGLKSLVSGPGFEAFLLGEKDGLT